MRLDRGGKWKSSYWQMTPDLPRHEMIRCFDLAITPDRTVAYIAELREKVIKEFLITPIKIVPHYRQLSVAAIEHLQKKITDNK